MPAGRRVCQDDLVCGGGDDDRTVSLDDGFDFLGFTVRRQSGKLLIKPSKAALRRIRERLRTEMRALRGANATMVLVRLNPIIQRAVAFGAIELSAVDDEQR